MENAWPRIYTWILVLKIHVNLRRIGPATELMPTRSKYNLIDDERENYPDQERPPKKNHPLQL